MSEVLRQCAPFIRACVEVRKAIDEHGGAYTRQTPEGERLWQLFQGLHAQEEQAWAKCRAVSDDLLAELESLLG